MHRQSYLMETVNKQLFPPERLSAFKRGTRRAWQLQITMLT